MIRSRLLALLTAVLLLGQPPLATAETSAFDELDAMLEDQFQTLDADLEAQFLALDEALEAAYQRLGKEVEAEWGSDEVELPDKKRWIDYSEDRQLRRKIDFENGVIEIEHLVENEAERQASLERIVNRMRDEAQSVAKATMQDLSQRDDVLNYAREALAEADVELVESSVPPEIASVLSTLVTPAPSNDELKEMVVKASEKKAEQKAEQSDAGIKVEVADLNNQKQKVKLTIPLRFGFETTLASKYREDIITQAREYELAPSLLYAVMETESSFNPRARSPVPAFGLMQLVPRSGAMDAYQYVYGEKTLLDPEYLYVSEQNIELGAAYLNLLYTRYLRHISHPLSREYCMIAAYNTGAGNVARSFTGKTNVKSAATMINELTPEQVFNHLLHSLPYEETRNYLRKVTRAKQKYSALDQYVFTGTE